MPFPFSRKAANASNYEAVEADDYNGLEEDGFDVAPSLPRHDGQSASTKPTSPTTVTPSAVRPGRVSSRLSQLSGNWSELGLPKSPKSPKTDVASGDPTADSAGQQAFRRASRDATSMSHPAPGLEVKHGAYLDNILRLEDSAERMSVGMDIEAELKKLREEQKEADNRRPSLTLYHQLQQQKQQQGQTEEKVYSRPTSVQSRAGEIASPSTYLAKTNSLLLDTSAQETASRYSSSNPQSPENARPPSSRSAHLSPTAQTSGLQTVFEDAGKSMTAEEREPALSRTLSAAVQNSQKEIIKRRQIHSVHGGPLSASNYEPDFRQAGPQNSEEDEEESVYTPLVQQEPAEQRLMYQEKQYLDPDGSYGQVRRRGSAGSMDTFQQAETLFRDFDGDHVEHHDRYQDDEPDDGDSTPRNSRRQSNATMMQDRLGDVQLAAEPLDGDEAAAKRQTMLSTGMPDVKRKSTMTMGPVRPQTPPDGHVYYPAPIPAILHLPPKLSRGRTAADMQRKKEEIIMSANARKSALMPGMYDASSMKGAPTTELDPRLKASLYFDHKPVKHVLRLINGSATRTLDHILNVSAGAPLGAFTDHPFAGKLGPEVYGPEIKAKDRKSVQPLANNRKSTRPLTTAYHQESGQDDDDTSEANVAPYRDEGYEDGDEDALAVDEHGVPSAEANHFQNNVPEYIPVDATKPTTLLAELQIRKQEQKQRNRTAATAFPNGMHSTLLQLDAVAQHHAQARRTRQIRLAWEDPEALQANDDDDDEVPLGVLMPGAQRPEGGLLPPVPQPRETTPSPAHFDEAEEEEDDDEPEETMAQRKARLAREAEEKKRYTLNVEGLAEANKSDDDDDDVPLAVRKARMHRRMSSDFASEVMSQLGGLDDETEKASQASPAKAKKIPARHRASRSALSALSTAQLSSASAGEKKVPEAEETLGQRRRRLRAEQEARESAKLLQKEVQRRKSSVDLLNNPDGKDATVTSPRAQSNSIYGLGEGNDTRNDSSADLLSAGNGLQAGAAGLASSTNLVMGADGVLHFKPSLSPQFGPIGGGNVGIQQAPIPLQQQDARQSVMWAQMQPPILPQFRQAAQRQAPAVFMHPAYAAAAAAAAAGAGAGNGYSNAAWAQQQQQQQFAAAASLGRPGHLSAYQQQQLMGMGAMAGPLSIAGNRMSVIDPGVVNTGRRDMVDRWRQGVMG